MPKISCAAAILTLVFTLGAWAQSGDEPVPPVDPAEPEFGVPTPEELEELLREYEQRYGPRLRPEFAPDVTRPRHLEIRTPRPLACLAQRPGTAASAWDPCEFGRRVAELPPCFGPRNCQALDLWRGEIGEPEIHGARPPEDGTGSSGQWTFQLPIEGGAAPATEDDQPSRD